MNRATKRERGGDDDCGDSRNESGIFAAAAAAPFVIVGAVSPYAIPAVPRDAVAGDEEKEQGLEMRLELEEEGYKIPLPLSTRYWHFTVQNS